MALNPPKTIQERFDEFHAKNPHVYTALVGKARAAVARGYNTIGVALLVELIRWDLNVKTNGRDHFKISNDYRSHYARLIMSQEADLQGLFKIRPLESA